MELKVIEQVQKLTWNFDEVKKELASHIQKYVGLVVNEDNLKDMEKTQKEIAGLRVKLGKFRLAVKKDLAKPYEMFEMQVQELLGLVESAEKPIKDQLEKYEINRREEKENICKELIAKTAIELGLEEKYSKQIIVDSKWVNRGTSIKSIKEDIQMRVVYFLDQQRQDKEAETFRQQKIEMAKFMIESLSIGLITPLTFSEVENKIDALNIGELRTYIENIVAGRKEREERAAQQALECAERERLAEIARQKKAEQPASQQTEQECIFKENQQQLKDMEEIFTVPQKQAEPEKKYNARFTIFGIDLKDIEIIEDFFSMQGIQFKKEVKEVIK